jgi:hypothetical protein
MMGGREKAWPPKKQPARRPSIAGDRELAGVSKSRARGLHLQIKGYRGEAEVKASLIECISRLGEGSHGLALNDGEKELVGMRERRSLRPRFDKLEKRGGIGDEGDQS